MTRKKRLGRGLEALLNSTSEPSPAGTAAVVATDSIHPPELAAASTVSDSFEPSPPVAPNRVVVTESFPPADIPLAPEEGAIVHVNVDEIDDNPFQPRRVFDEHEIATLAKSLDQHDILQPILVRVVDGRYQLISGERRLRAAIKANWQTIPARLRVADDRLVSELSIVENLLRKDLNPIEKALCFKRYINEHNCKHEDLANRLGIDRSTVANLMRLLELPVPIQDALQSSQLSAGHARALLPLGDEQIQIEFCDEILKQGLSVRATERAVAEKINAEDSTQTTISQRSARTRDPQIESLQLELKQALGTKVVVKQGTRQKGQIIVHYANHDEFERLHAHLVGTSKPPQLKIA